MMEEKKQEKKEEKELPLDSVEQARMISLIDLLSEFLRRKFGPEFQLYDAEYDEQSIPEKAVFMIYDKKEEKFLNAEPYISKLPDWLRPFAKTRISTRESYLLLQWTSKIRKVYEGVTAELKAMGPEETTRDELELEGEEEDS